MNFKFEIKTEPATKAAVGIIACIAISKIAVHQKTKFISSVCAVSAVTVAYSTLRELNPRPVPNRPANSEKRKVIIINHGG